MSGGLIIMSKDIGLNYRDKQVRCAAQTSGPGALICRLLPASMPLMLSGVAVVVGWYFFA